MNGEAVTQQAAPSRQFRGVRWFLSCPNSFAVGPFSLHLAANRESTLKPLQEVLHKVVNDSLTIIFTRSVIAHETQEVVERLLTVPIRRLVEVARFPHGLMKLKLS